jgi:hypothetical protein
MSITILKKELEGARWSAIFKKLNSEQISKMLKQSKVQPNHCDEMALEIGRSIKRGVVFTEDEQIHFF